MSFLWSQGGVTVGTEFAIIAGCLQGIQMLKLLFLIIKYANLRKRLKDIIRDLWTFKFSILHRTISYVTSSNTCFHLWTHLSSTQDQKENINLEMTETKTLLRNLDFDIVVARSKLPFCKVGWQGEYVQEMSHIRLPFEVSLESLRFSPISIKGNLSRINYSSVHAFFFSFIQIWLLDSRKL